MNKRDILEIMHSSFDEANKVLCLQNGMTEQDSNESIEKSKVAVEFLLTAVLDKLQEKNIVTFS